MLRRVHNRYIENPFADLIHQPLGESDLGSHCKVRSSSTYPDEPVEHQQIPQAELPHRRRQLRAAPAAPPLADVHAPRPVPALAHSA